VGGCVQTIPVAVIGQDGTVLKGSNTVSFSGGSFSVTDGVLICAGSYNAANNSRIISMVVTCNDGRKGIVRAIRDTNSSGSGTFRLNDGYEGDFIFGDSAVSFW